MQETFIKVITELHKFKHKSEFKTWVYRIIKNLFLNTRRNKSYSHTIPWEEYGTGLSTIADEEIDDVFSNNKKHIVEEAKLSCMKGMLLCLTPEQKIIYIMGELFEITDSIRSEVMEITKANFRKKLSRARQQLYGFMNNKCGLINVKNPCRCARKTKGFIEKGYIDPKNLQFQTRTIAKINQVVDEKLGVYENEGYKAYQDLFQKHNYQSPDDNLASLKKLLNSDPIRRAFDL